MTAFDAALAGFAAMDDKALARRWTFRDRPMDVRYAIYRTLEEAQDAHIQVATRSHPESRRILSFAQRAFGELRAVLAGLPDHLLDASPGEGEWPVRETLGHVLFVERRYAVQTEYAVERADSDPIRIADDRLPPLAEMDVSGGIDDILARIGAARVETDRRLGHVAPSAMTRPTVWAQLTVDVRFRLHRFAAHVVEHTIQCEKTLEALGWRATEGRRIVRRLAGLVGEIDGLGGEAEARAIEEMLANRLRSVSTG
jgi:hypothetical protein